MQIQIRETPRRPPSQPLSFEASHVALALDRFAHRIAGVEVRVRREGRLRAKVQVHVRLLDGRRVDASARGEGLVASVIARAIDRARERLGSVGGEGWTRQRVT
jgi:hypothetical protein